MSPTTLPAASSCAPRSVRVGLGRRRRRAVRAQPGQRSARPPRSPPPTTRRSSACSCTAATTRRTWCCAPTAPRSTSYTRMRATGAGSDRAARAGHGAPNVNATRARRRDSAACCRSFRSSPSSTRERAQHLRAASEHARGREPVRRPARLAILANAGPLVVPLTKAEYTANSKPRPQALGSHNDQQSTWQALGPEGRHGRLGRPPRRPGRQRQQQRRSSPASRSRATRSSRPGRRRSSTRSAATARSAIGGITGNAVRLDRRPRRRCSSIVTAEQPAPVRAGVQRRSSTARSTAQAAFQSAPSAPRRVAAPTQYFQPSTGNNANNGLAQQLQTVARIIGARSALGAKRQIFFVAIGGFDTHDNQNASQRRPDGAPVARDGYFDTALANVGGVDLRNNVTLVHRVRLRPHVHQQRRRHRPRLGWPPFRARAARSRAARSTAASRCFGLNNNQDSTNNAYLPVTSVDTIGSTLGRWFGVSDANLDTVFPNLKNFHPGPRLPEAGLSRRLRRARARLPIGRVGRRQHPSVLDRLGDVRHPAPRRLPARSAIVRATRSTR